ncbi:hypothetical protein [Nannocystis punicea]|uniref:Uncharacterized protein n=1 Tax=Nannocystis punicea TaxID=2995304 RepID=A0ABY7HFB0_9BACT|nr:hypothetical protein [Nannocystis poenicansa]WAS97965.1 hypothetical protein O0S08_17635 [Nannocystis poenicansa]
MTLITHAYVREADGGMRTLDAEPPRNDLAGPERWRVTVYGSDAARALGLTLLPTLATEDVYAEGEELDVLEREIQVMLANTARWPAIGLEQLRFRFFNILEAIRLARAEAHGGVYVG